MAITDLPTPPARTDAPATFITRADAFIGALPVFVTEANAQAAALTLNSTNDTSVSSVAIGTGAKTFTVTAGKSFQPGMYLVIADTAAPSTNSMWGQVTSYTSTTLVMNILTVLGSGTKTAWVISQSASTVSYTGATTFTGAINTSRATVASAATTADIWAALGNQIGWTGTVTCTGFPAAPQAGASRKLICAAAAPFTAGANMLINGYASAATVTLAANDEVIVEAITTTQFKLTITKYSGLAVISPSEIFPITASVNASALTATLDPCAIAFRSATLTSGAVSVVPVNTAITVVVSNGSSLGFTATQAGRIAVLAINNAGTVELAVCNAYGSANLDEGTLITTVAEGGAGAADSADSVYSTTQRTSVAFRIVGYLDIVPAASHAWTAAPTTIQGAGGMNSLVKNATSILYTDQSTASGTAWTFSNIPPWAKEITISIEDFSTNGTSIPLVQIGDAGGFETTNYSGSVAEPGVTTVNLAAGFSISNNTAAASVWHGTMILQLESAPTNTWSASGLFSKSDTAAIRAMAGSKSLSQPLNQIRLTMTNGTDAGDAGSVGCYVT